MFRHSLVGHKFHDDSGVCLQRCGAGFGVAVASGTVAATLTTVSDKCIIVVVPGV